MSSVPHDFSAPCDVCRDGRHDECVGGLCGCIAEHRSDDALMRGFKRMKRQIHPERESQVKGGWGA